MITVSFYDTKSYDRHYFERAPGADRLHRTYHDFRLTSKTAGTIGDADAVCVFVNDRLDAECLAQLQNARVRLIARALRGFNK